MDWNPRNDGSSGKELGGAVEVPVWLCPLASHRRDGLGSRSLTPNLRCLTILFLEEEGGADFITSEPWSRSNLT